MNTVEVSDLSMAERFIVWSLRLGLLPQLDSSSARSALISAFNKAHVGNALPFFIDMTDVLSTVWHEMQRVPDIHCTCCSRLGRDEWCLLQVIATLQTGDEETAAGYLSTLMPPLGIDLVLGRAKHVAEALSEVGWVVRQLSFEAANQPVFASFEPAHSLH